MKIGLLARRAGARSGQPAADESRGWPGREIGRRRGATAAAARDRRDAAGRRRAIVRGGRALVASAAVEGARARSAVRARTSGRVPVAKVVRKNGYTHGASTSRPTGPRCRTPSACGSRRAASRCRAPTSSRRSSCWTWRWAPRPIASPRPRPGTYEHAAPALVMVGHWGLSFDITPPGGCAVQRPARRQGKRMSVRIRLLARAARARLRRRCCHDRHRAREVGPWLSASHCSSLARGARGGPARAGGRRPGERLPAHPVDLRPARPRHLGGGCRPPLDDRCARTRRVVIRSTSH